MGKEDGMEMKRRHRDHERNTEKHENNVAFDRKQKSLSSSSQLSVKDRDKKHHHSCRENVIEFAVNASDIKDECEGFRRAFEASCSTIEQDNHFRHRRLTLSSENSASVQNIFKNLKYALTRRIFSSREMMIQTKSENEYDNNVKNNRRKLQDMNGNRNLPLLSLPTKKEVNYETIKKTVLLQDNIHNNEGKQKHYR